MYNTQTPFMASYVIVRRKGKVAFLMRSNTPWGNGYYGLPSGKVEVNDGAIATAVKEAKEEINITVNANDLKFVHCMHRHEETNWVDIFFEANAYTGEIINAESEKHSEVAWLDPKNMPDNVLEYVRIAMTNIENGELYSEYKWSKK